MTHKMRILLILLLISCSKKENSVIKIRYWAFGGTPTVMKWTKERVAAFNSIHPDINVELSQKSWSRIRELLYTNMTTRAGPDVIRIHANYAAEFGEAGFLYPINHFPDFNEIKKWYYPNFFKSTKYKNNYYGLPMSAVAFVLVCNKKLFDQDNINPPQTWSEFRKAARKLTKDNNGDGSIDQYGLVLLGAMRGGFSYRLAPFMLKAGAKILSDDLKRVEFNSPAAISAVKLFADMFQIDHSVTPGFLSYTMSETNDLFANDRVAMSIEGPWFRGILQEKKPGKNLYTVPIPVPDSRVQLYHSSPSLQDMVMISISTYTEYPDESWELIKFLRCPEADMDWIRQDMGGIAVTVQALNRPEADNIPDLSVYKHELSFAQSWPPHPKMIAIVRNVIAPYAQKAIIGELDVQQAMNKAAKEAQEFLDGK